jgi:hypothetical protein
MIVLSHGDTKFDLTRLSTRPKLGGDNQCMSNQGKAERIAQLGRGTAGWWQFRLFFDEAQSIRSSIDPALLGG